VNFACKFAHLSQTIVKLREDFKSHFQVAFVDYLNLLSDSDCAFSARMALSRLCLSISMGLHQQEKKALLQAQQIDDELLTRFLASVVNAGGLLCLCLIPRLNLPDRSHPPDGHG
jgi:hypothetical protein